jgi:hypothetical protein
MSRKMNAYYYGFDETGVDVIDDLLEQIAIAGKMHHNTNAWADTDDNGESYISRIQQSARVAAETFRTLSAPAAPKIDVLGNGTEIVESRASSNVSDPVAPADGDLCEACHGTGQKLLAIPDYLRKFPDEPADGELLKALKNLLDVFERCEAGFSPEIEFKFAVRDEARAAIANHERTKNEK